MAKRVTGSIGSPVFGLVGEVTGPDGNDTAEPDGDGNGDGDSGTVGDSADGCDTAAPEGDNIALPV